GDRSAAGGWERVRDGASERHRSRGAGPGAAASLRALLLPEASRYWAGTVDRQAYRGRARRPHLRRAACWGWHGVPVRAAGGGSGMPSDQLVDVLLMLFAAAAHAGIAWQDRGSKARWVPHPGVLAMLSLALAALPQQADPPPIRIAAYALGDVLFVLALAG